MSQECSFADRKSLTVWIGLLVVAWLGPGARVSTAQSTLFNIPTTDVVAPAKLYFELDYLAQMPKPEDPAGGPPAERLHVVVPRLVIGLGGNVEIGANIAYYHSGGTTAVFQPNLKWQLFSGKSGFAAALGGIVYTPLTDRHDIDTNALVYANLSKKVDHPYGPRFHVGPYGVVFTNDAFAGPKAGVLAGYEQPLHPKLTLVADWLSGKNGFGYFTPGLSVALPRSSVLNVGYSFGNDSFENDNATRNRLLFVYYGITF